MAFRVAQDVVDEFYRRHSTSATLWELHATTLRYSVEILFRQAFADTAFPVRHRKRKTLRPSPHGPALMLAGMMIEDLAKAVLVSRSKTLLSKALLSHDLGKIVSATGYSASSDEQDLLKRLSAFVRWAGRYPAPRKPTEMTVETSDGGRQLVGGSLLGADLRGIRQIADKLEVMLPGERVRRGMRLPTGNAKADPWRPRRGH